MEDGERHRRGHRSRKHPLNGHNFPVERCKEMVTVGVVVFETFGLSFNRD